MVCQNRRTVSTLQSEIEAERQQETRQQMQTGCAKFAKLEAGNEAEIADEAAHENDS
jgi:hypothetical protein